MLGKIERTGARYGQFPVATAFSLSDKACRGGFPYNYFDAWRPLMFYAIAPTATSVGAPGDAGARLRVNGKEGVDAVVILPGRPLASEGQSIAARLSSPMASREFLESHPHDPSAHNWQTSPYAPDDHYALARPILSGERQFNDTVECLSITRTNPCPQ